jgi:hypothetical protein
MRRLEILCLVLTALLISAFVPAHARVLEEGKATSVKIAGRTVQCKIERTGKLAKISVIKASYSEGEAASMSTTIFLHKPAFFQAKPVVQLYIFYHECGHTQIDGGGTELRADTWATKFGVEQGWLDTEEDYKAVCASWGDAPASPPHPSGKTRCAHLKKWMAIYKERQQIATKPNDLGEPEKPMPEAKKSPWRAWSILSYWGLI